MKKLAPGVDDSSEALEVRLTEMDRKLDRLRALYESFFLGIERAPPNVPRRELNRLILELQQIQITNASLRFRFQSLTQRWVLHTAYWNRTLREIEAGTYRRDLARVQRHMAQKGGLLSESDALALGIPSSRVKAFVARQAQMRDRMAGTTGGPKGPARGGAKPAPIGGITDADMAAVHRRYLEAHQRAQDPRPALTLEKMKDRLAAQIPKIMSEQKCQSVKLDVIVEDGRVRLKAWPKT